MKTTKDFARLNRRPVLILAVTALLITGYAAQYRAQRGDSRPITPEVQINVLSAVVTRFDKPIRIGPPRRAIEYREALVLKVEVDKEAFDSLPPDMEPFLYIGRNEYRIFAVDRQDNRRTLTLTFHIRDWTQLSDGSVMTLTIDHGAPVRSPEIFERRQGPRFNKAMIVDRRQPE